jgi:hypothetical protein
MFLVTLDTHSLVGAGDRILRLQVFFLMYVSIMKTLCYISYAITCEEQDEMKATSWRLDG